MAAAAGGGGTRAIYRLIFSHLRSYMAFPISIQPAACRRRGITRRRRRLFMFWTLAG